MSRRAKKQILIPGGKTVVDAGHVDTAIKERFERVSLIEDKIQEMIDEGSILIDTQGAVVGQVNDLVDKEIERLARVAKDAGKEKDAKKD